MEESVMGRIRKGAQMLTSACSARWYRSATRLHTLSRRLEQFVSLGIQSGYLMRRIPAQIRNRADAVIAWHEAGYSRAIVQTGDSSPETAT
jgi:hypothetical protein